MPNDSLCLEYHSHLRTFHHSPQAVVRIRITAASILTHHSVVRDARFWRLCCSVENEYTNLKSREPHAPRRLCTNYSTHLKEL